MAGGGKKQMVNPVGFPDMQENNENSNVTLQLGLGSSSSSSSSAAAAASASEKKDQHGQPADDINLALSLGGIYAAYNNSTQTIPLTRSSSSVSRTPVTSKTSRAEPEERTALLSAMTGRRIEATKKFLIKKATNG